MIDISDEYTKPMMSDAEIAIIDQMLERKHDMSCLEWGSGNSTIYFPKQHEMFQWMSIEDNPEYAEYVEKRADRKKVWMYLKTEKDDYINYPAQHLFFDFILVDGKFRRECVSVALKLVKRGGIVLLHDAGRREYADWLKQYPYETLIAGEIDDGNGFYKHRGLIKFWTG